MRVELLALALLFIIPAAYGQLPEGNIKPPSLPSGNETLLILHLFDDNGPVGDIHARLTLAQNGESLETLKYVPEDGNLNLRVQPGWWSVNILIDDIGTPGKDYTYDTAIRAPASEQIYLIPTGSLKGTVMRNHDAVPNAQVLLYCSGEEDVRIVTTDIAGNFIEDWLPIGQCTIVATKDNKRGERSVTLSQGSLANATVTLDQGVISETNWSIISLAVLTLIILGISGKKLNDINRKRQEKQTSRMNDIINTLSHKERTVIEFLIEHNNKSTQATIKNNTGIPKTSLIRLFDSLERKHLITITRIGKMKKITLTGWFLGKSANRPKNKENKPKNG